ncbi:hypothetical protein ACIGHN_27075 [Acidovorax sp. NPDC077693]|uniref:hypothetical protein n=1 Tax=unclassified Acidovorax TaxID=2684926 RepID=UPI0037CA6A72
MTSDFIQCGVDMTFFKKSFLAASCVFFCASSSAAGYFSAPTKFAYDGWACNPDIPQFSGWVHFWRDDGKFLGALHAGMQREAAIGEICRDGGGHGFNGTLSIPYEFLDNKKHTVRAYFINPDNTSFELQNSVDVVFDGGPQPYVFNVQSSNACQLPSPYWGAAGWVLRDTNPDLEYCQSTNGYHPTPSFVYLADPNIPVGTEIDVCGSRTNAPRIPGGWQTIRTKQDSKCISQITTVTVRDKPNHKITYDDTWTIRKTQ